MLENMIITLFAIFIAVDLVKHIIFPIAWSIFKGRKDLLMA
jgi:hypothetical protein